MSEAAQSGAGDAPATNDTSDPIAPAPAPPAEAPREVGKRVVVRYGLMRHVGSFRHSLNGKPVRPGTKVVVRTQRGVELGEVVTNICGESAPGCITPEALNDFIKANGSDYPFRRNGRVLRLANHQDVIDYDHLERSAREEAQYCREQIRQLKLAMKIVAVEHLLGGERIIFCFSAKGRVDFRDLVHHLATEYRTRIEMRQVGARDEARLVGDYERCGRPCCCRQFLKDLKPVSMRMAKTQKATLDPGKISGRCGRLMCCLRYEDVGYEELRKALPYRNTWVRHAGGVGRVVSTQTLTQLVRVSLPDGTTQAIGNEDILERDLPAPQKDQPAKPAAGKYGRRRSDAPGAARPAPAATGATQGDRATDVPGEGDRAPKSKRKRRRRKKAPAAEAPRDQSPEPVAPAAATTEPAAQAPPDQPAGTDQSPTGQGDDKTQPARKKRRRKNRRKGKPK